MHVVLVVGGPLAATVGWCGLSVAMIGVVDGGGGCSRQCSCILVGCKLGFLLVGVGRSKWLLRGA